MYKLLVLFKDVCELNFMIALHTANHVLLHMVELITYTTAIAEQSLR
jgi:hypothetical protein